MSIENKSRSKVSVKGQDKLTKHFPYNKTDEAGLYIADLKRQGYKPRLEVLDEAWLVRWTVNGKRVSKTVATRAEAEQTEASIAGEQARRLFIDYTKGHHVTFGSLLIKAR